MNLCTMHCSGVIIPKHPQLSSPELEGKRGLLKGMLINVEPGEQWTSIVFNSIFDVTILYRSAKGYARCDDVQC